MKKLNVTLKSIILCAFILTCASLAPAQQRKYVSGAGNDANPCTLNSPCRNFQRGHDAVAAGGEVVALDSASYGPLSINKSVTISGEGVRAAVAAPAAPLSGNGVVINAAGATVILRELTITSSNNSAGGIGVWVVDAATVYIERCVITSFSSGGISYRTNNRLFITDTVSRSNGSDGFAVALAPAGGTAHINIDGCRFEQNALNGIDLTSSTIEASITNSIMSGNGNDGLAMFGTDNSRANVAHSTAANNGRNGFAVGQGANQLNIEYSVTRGNASSGMWVDVGSTIRVSNSVATNNNFGFNNLGGTFESRLNNTVKGNTLVDTNGAITPLTAQ